MNYEVKRSKQGIATTEEYKATLRDMQGELMGLIENDEKQLKHFIYTIHDFENEFQMTAVFDELKEGKSNDRCNRWL